MQFTDTRTAQVGDNVLIDGEAGTVTRVQLIGNLLIVSAGSHKIEADGEGSLLMEVFER